MIRTYLAGEGTDKSQMEIIPSWQLDSFLEVGGMRSIHSAKDGCHEMSFPTSS